MQTVMVTGGAGFIGAALVRELVGAGRYYVLNVDVLTCAAHPCALGEVVKSSRYRHERVDICDRPALDRLFERYRPDRVVHLAAETHVDRSIADPAVFLKTNVTGVMTLLEAARGWYERLGTQKRREFRFHHVSTDEVFGDLSPEAPPFDECAPYGPGSPYAASKASGEHLVRAWQRTYGLPTLITRSSNNYGPWHLPDKLIPLTIVSALEGLPIPVYGQGLQRRDWLYVEDHARALALVLERGEIGQGYNIGARQERPNIEMAKAVCKTLERLGAPRPPGIERFEALITHVADRPGHDRRYAINPGKIEQALGWHPRESLESGLEKTVRWYLTRGHCCERMRAVIGDASRKAAPAAP